MSDKIVALAKPEHSIENIEETIEELLEYAKEYETVLMIAVTVDKDDTCSMWVGSDGNTTLLRGLGALEWLKDTFKANDYE